MSRTISRIQKNHKEDTCLKEIIIHAWSERRQQNLHFKKASIEMSTMSKISIYELQNSEVNVCSLDLGGLLIILYWLIQFHFINTLREVMLTSKKKTCAYHGTHSITLLDFESNNCQENSHTHFASLDGSVQIYYYDRLT